MMRFHILVLVISIIAFLYQTNCKQQTVTIIGTNDIHGWAFPIKLTRKDNNQSYNLGGLSTMASIINIIKRSNPGNTLYLDGGDQFQGNIQNSDLVSNGRIMNAFYDTIGLDASAIGNHQFDYGYKFLETYLSDRVAVNLGANLRTTDSKDQFLPNQKKSKVFSLKNGIKIGVIGLSTITTPAQSVGFFPPFNINNITFTNFNDIVIKQSKSLRDQGANAVIVVGHVGDRCFIDQTYGIWTKQSKQAQCRKDQLNIFINSLPQGVIDGVVQGHMHCTAHNYIKGIPIIGTTQGAQYLNILQLKFKDGKLDSTSIEGPIPVCQKVFQKTRLCKYIDSAEDLSKAGPLVEWSFKGQVVKPDERFEQWLNNVWAPKLKSYQNVICQNQLHLKVSHDQQTLFSTLLMNLMQAQFPSAHIGLASPSGIRSEIYPGPVRYIDIYNAMPIDYTLKSYEMPAGDLLKVLYLIQSTEDAFFFAFGVQQTLYISKDKLTRGFINAKWQNGTAIDPTKIIQVVAPQMIIQSIQISLQVLGQDLLKISKVTDHGSIRQLFVSQLKKYGDITADKLLNNSINPRMIIYTM